MISFKKNVLLVTSLLCISSYVCGGISKPQSQQEKHVTFVFTKQNIESIAEHEFVKINNYDNNYLPSDQKRLDHVNAIIAFRNRMPNLKYAQCNEYCDKVNQLQEIYDFRLDINIQDERLRQVIEILDDKIQALYNKIAYAKKWGNLYLGSVSNAQKQEILALFKYPERIKLDFETVSETCCAKS